MADFFTRENFPMISSIVDYSNRNRQKMSTQQGRSTSMNNYVKRTPVSTAPKSTAFQNEQYLVDRANSLPKDIIPVAKPTVVQTDIAQPVSSVARSRNGGLMAPPPMVTSKPQTSSLASVVQPSVVPASSVADNYNYGGMTQQDFTPMQTGNAQDTFWENLTRAGGYSAQEWNAMTPEQRIQAGAQKSNLASGMEQFGQLAGGASALAGIYGTIQNAKYLKDQTKMQKNMIRSDDANKSQFAKAAGGTYTKTGV